MYSVGGRSGHSRAAPGPGTVTLPLLLHSTIATSAVAGSPVVSLACAGPVPLHIVIISL